MAVGESIVSTFGGPVDADAFGFEFPVPAEKTHKINYSEEQMALHKLYGKLRNIRNQRQNYDELVPMWHILQKQYRDDWLLPMEIAEVLAKEQVNKPLKSEILTYLTKMKQQLPQFAKLIDRGVKLI
jgi:phenylalanine-4-hydroxylase